MTQKLGPSSEIGNHRWAVWWEQGSGEDTVGERNISSSSGLYSSFSTSHWLNLLESIWHWSLGNALSNDIEQMNGSVGQQITDQHT